MSIEHEVSLSDDTIHVSATLECMDVSFMHQHGVRSIYQWHATQGSLTVMAYINDIDQWIDITARLTATQIRSYENTLLDDFYVKGLNNSENRSSIDEDAGSDR